MNPDFPKQFFDQMNSFWQNYKFLILLTVIFVMIGYLSVLFLGKNNLIEVEIEKVIEMETGLKIDLTP